MSTEATDHRELVEFEQQVLGNLQAEAEDPVLEEMEVEQQTAAAAAPTAPAPKAEEQQAETKPEAEKGDVRAALRASRRNERRAIEQAEQLRRDLEALRQQTGTTEPAEGADEISTALAQLEADVPQAAAVIKHLAKKIEGLQPQSAAQAEAEPEFIPQTLPADMQDAVDEVPDILEWQTTQEGADKWELAKATDALLIKHPAWKDKPITERLQEVARRVNQEVGSPAAKPGTMQPAAILQARERGIETLSDLRGGGLPNTSRGVDFHSMKSDAEIMAALAKEGLQ